MGTIGGTAGVRWLAVFSGVAPLAEPAFAGAWTQPANASQSISTISREENAVGETWRADDFGEYGLGGGWGFNLKFENETRITTASDNRLGFHAGVQKSFALGDRSSFSMIATYLGGESLDGPDCQGQGYETRAALGTSYSLGERNGFVNAEVGWRSRGSCEREMFEVTAGIDIAPRIGFVAKAWNEDGTFAQSTKLESTLLYEWDDELAIGFGWREELSGDFEEQGWVLSLWRRS
ncbi:MAG: hypothetical protein Q8R02_06150 [Hyphomonadaceae bacterium]|nr:hypothetical protein [Hyphomonadaceae bacterium]